MRRSRASIGSAKRPGASWCWTKRRSSRIPTPSRPKPSNPQGAHRSHRDANREQSRDLWSIFDFVIPGLLGSSKAFANFVKALASQPHVSYAPLRRLVQPYILRRLKSDKSIIADLPDKTEIKAFCHLTRKQAALYQAAVAELEQRLQQSADGIARRGMVLSLPYAPQADLQSPHAMAGRRRL
jgi:SNF2-related domain